MYDPCNENTHLRRLDSYKALKGCYIYVPYSRARIYLNIKITLEKTFTNFAVYKSYKVFSFECFPATQYLRVTIIIWLKFKV